VPKVVHTDAEIDASAGSGWLPVARVERSPGQRLPARELSRGKQEFLPAATEIADPSCDHVEQTFQTRSILGPPLGSPFATSLHIVGRCGTRSTRK
jgi:hypothetical protein